MSINLDRQYHRWVYLCFLEYVDGRRLKPVTFPIVKKDSIYCNLVKTFQFFRVLNINRSLFRLNIRHMCHLITILKLSEVLQWPALLKMAFSLTGPITSLMKIFHVRFDLNPVSTLNNWCLPTNTTWQKKKNWMKRFYTRHIKYNCITYHYLITSNRTFIHEPSIYKDD